MRKLGLIALLAALTALVAIGCGEDDPKPAISRLFVSESCGVAPLRVDFRADATGGTPLGDPTGGNNWLTMRWDFGDGTVIEDGAAVAYHRYEEPGVYTVTVTAEDDEGESASRSREVVVQADSLSIEAYGLLEDQPTSTIAACEPLQLGITAETCGFDPVTDSYERFVFRWRVGDSVYTSPFPRHSFAPDQLGDQVVTLVLEDPTRSITRRDTVAVTVVESPGVDVSLAADWLQSPQPSETETLERDVPSFPDTLTYTIRVINDGPATAYNLEVTGDLPAYNRLLFLRADTESGQLAYDSTQRLWVWDVPQVNAGEEQVVHVSFYVETASQGASYGFPTVLTPYACDPDDDDLAVEPVLIINSRP